MLSIPPTLKHPLNNKWSLASIQILQNKHIKSPHAANLSSLLVTLFGIANQKTKPCLGMFYNVKSDQLEHQKQFLILMVRVLAFFQSLGSVSSGQWSWVVVRRVLRVFWNTTGEGQHQKPSGVTAIITFLILVWPCSTLVCLILAIFNKFLQQYSLKKWHLQSTEYTSRIVRITQTLFFF